MNFLDQITADIKAAMLAKNKVALEALRGIKKELLEARSAKGGTDEISEEVKIKILQKMIKQRKDSAAMFTEQNREDLVEPELAQIKIIEPYLPAQLSEEEVEAVVKSIIEKVGATSMKDMGKVMGAATSELAGKAEGKVISSKVKALLA